MSRIESIKKGGALSLWLEGKKEKGGFQLSLLYRGGGHIPLGFDKSRREEKRGREGKTIIHSC